MVVIEINYQKKFWGMDRFRVEAIEKNLIKNILAKIKLN